MCVWQLLLIASFFFPQRSRKQSHYPWKGFQGAECHGWRRPLSKWRKFGRNSASSKGDIGCGNGPLPVEGTDLVEEMSALLARRKRIAEKGSTIETTKRDKNEDSEPVTSKASSTVHLNRQENLGKERIQGMAASHLLFPDVILRRKIRSFWPQALWLITQTKLCTLVTGRCRQSPDGGPGLGQIEAGHFRWNKKRIKPKEKLSDAIKPEVSKSNVA